MILNFSVILLFSILFNAFDFVAPQSEAFS